MSKVETMLVRPKVLVALAVTTLVLNNPPGHCMELTKLVERTGAQIQQGGREESGRGRFLASLFFPIFPQFHGVNYGDVLENFAKPNTIAFFIIQHLIMVRSFNLKKQGIRIKLKLLLSRERCA